jgi:hypothetical protein
MSVFPAHESCSRPLTSTKARFHASINKEMCKTTRTGHFAAGLDGHTVSLCEARGRGICEWPEGKQVTAATKLEPLTNWSVPRSSTREIVGEGGLTGQLNASCSRGRVRGKSTFSGMPLAGASESRFRRRIRWMAEVPGEAGGEEEEADTIVVAVGGMGRIEESAPSRLRGVGGGEKGKEGVC